VAVGAGCRWHDHPSALGFNQIADEVVRELVAWFGHGDVVPRITDRRAVVAAATSKNTGSGLLTSIAALRDTIERQPMAPYFKGSLKCTT
jgi:hypothetical protein